MVMDPRLKGFIESINGYNSSNGGASVSNHHLTNILKLNNTCFDQNFMDFPPHLPPDLTNNYYSSVAAPSFSVSPDEDCPEDCDFSDVVLKYITQMLMEEDMEDKNCMFQESSALQAAEKPFYEILGEKYPPSPQCLPPPPPPPPLFLQQNVVDTQVDDYFNGGGSYTSSNYNNSNTTITTTTSSSSSSTSNGNTLETSWNGGGDLGEYHHHQSSPQLLHNFPTDYTFQATSQSSLSSTHSVNSVVVDGLVDSPVISSRVQQVPDIFCESQSFWQFQKGVEEANKFLPNDNDLIVSTESSNDFFHQQRKREANDDNNGVVLVVKMEKKDDREHSPNGSRGKKNLHRVDIDLEEGRSNKQSAVFKEETVRTPMFDSVLLCSGDKGEAAVSVLREALQTETNKNVQLNNSGHSKGGSNGGGGGGKSRGKKQSGSRKDMVDLRTLLIHCAQSVAADDRRSATELLKQIRQHSSPFGDGTQRLAHCFADGLEARLAGTGSQIYATLVNKKTSAADILKAYQLYLAACPFKKVSNYFSNQTIMNLAENATSLHIVDFGIYYGFQWPCLIQRLSGRPGGPPKLRITGIDLPQPGFRPAERIEETGRRLANYAESFNVPFEYNAIAQKWENIQLEDLKINRDEVLVVNCLYRFRNLLDETVVLDSPRSTVLQLVRKMNPNVFIHGIVNGAFSAPFFVTRFREALFHYSALFDMLETNVPREHPERILIEKDLFGREALNVIACEGSERVERPETYKQWQVRNMRAGFKQLPLNQEIMKKARDRAKAFYHKDFVIDEDSQWLLQGWKGRIIYGLSTWRPVHDS